MKSAIALSLFFSVALGACVFIKKEVRSATMRRVANSAVIVETETGMGSGTVIGRKGTAWIVLTCAHVVSDTQVAKIHTPNGEFGAVVDKYDAGLDLATLVTFGSIGLDVLPIATEEPALYDPMYTLTSPLGIPQTGSEAILYSKTKKLRDMSTRRWGFTGFIMPGSSGGTMTNVRGELVCVAEAVVANQILPIVPELGYCVGLEDIRGFVKSYDLGA